MTYQAYSFGAAVRGPLHSKEGRPNEDAWLRAKGPFGSLTVVCDGMGSKPNARVGSQAACAAVKEAVSHWSKADNAPVSYLSYLIEVLWRLRLYPMEPASAATTCLLALSTTRGSWIVGGVGDGLAFVRSDGELQVVIGDRGNDFANETSGLGDWPTPRHLDDKTLAVLCTPASSSEEVI